MDQKIIEKLKLKEIALEYGVSHLHNVKVYFYKGDITVTDGDFNGMPNQNDQVRFMKPGSYLTMGKEFIRQHSETEIYDFLLKYFLIVENKI